MKTSKNPKELSVFAQSALTLDQDFLQLESLGKQLDEADLETEFGLNQAKKLLAHYGECGERIGAEIQALAKALEDARIQAEDGAARVANRAVLIQKRYDEKEGLLRRFQSLGEMARTLTQSVNQLTQDGRVALTEHLPELQGNLDALLEDAKKIRSEAQQSKMKSLEKDAEAFAQMLASVRNRLKNASQSLN